MKIIPLDLADLIREGDVEGIKALVLSKLPLIAAAVLMIVFGFWLSNLIGRLIVRALRAKNVDPSIHNFIRTIITLILKFAIVLSALSAIGININSFIAALGAAGVAAGVGLQESVSQFASGILILINKPFKSGDYIELENVSGKVMEIKIMYTTLVTLDNKRVIVPNSHITSSNLINYNAEPKRRIDLVFSVSYHADLTRAKEVLARVAAGNERILKDPAPVIAVLEHGKSSVNLACYVWCNGSDYWDLLFYMQEKVKLAFDEEGIEIPFDQLDLHISKE